MSEWLRGLGLNPEAPVLIDSPCYRPPSWPPPLDWVVSVDEKGQPVSRWGEDFFDFSLWAGISCRLHFVGGPQHHVRLVKIKENQHILRLLATWITWAPYGSKSWSNVKACFGLVRRIVVLCDENNILASDLARYPQILSKVPELYKCRSERRLLLPMLDRLLRSRQQLRFTLLDEQGLKEIAQAFSAMEDDDPVQTAYIPPRIWTYQVLRLRECLDDFLKHKDKLRDCYNFCVDAYAHNFGSLERALLDNHDQKQLPFSQQVAKQPGLRNGRKFHGSFELTARQFGIEELLRAWVAPPSGSIDIRTLSAYFSLVEFAGHAYIANFTLQRSKEVAALRADCLVWEQDPVVGRIAIICGETTKTDPDSDARWPTSPSVSVAVDAMTTVARMRMRCAQANPLAACSEYDVENPFLAHSAFEPWSCFPVRRPYATRPTAQTYREGLIQFPLLFDQEKLRITEEDMQIALRFTPNLERKDGFAVGSIWPLAYHQLRRTTGINMFASGILSDTSIQVIMKHLTLLQSHYYLRNFSRVRFNDEAERAVVAARYEVMGRQIEAVVEDHYVSPLGEKRKDEIVVHLIAVKDCTKLAKAGRQGLVSFRDIRLGGCTKNGHCEYSGVESVARCAGGDGGKPCREVLYDKRKRESVARQLASAERRLEKLAPDTPRARALQSEVRGLRNYLDATRD